MGNRSSDDERAFRPRGTRAKARKEGEKGEKGKGGEKGGCYDPVICNQTVEHCGDRVLVGARFLEEKEKRGKKGRGKRKGGRGNWRSSQPKLLFNGFEGFAQERAPRVRDRRKEGEREGGEEVARNNR